MAHLHSIYDNDTHFKIDHITRGFTNESLTKTHVVQHDHNSERFTFELPTRYIEGHDMLECNRVEIHFLNIDKTTKSTSADVYIVEDLQESPNDENVVIFSWLISGNATKYVGNLNFQIHFKCLTDDKVDYRWCTSIYENIYVSSGINNSEQVAFEYSDVLEAWRKNLENLSSNALGYYTKEECDEKYQTKEDGMTREEIETFIEEYIGSALEEEV